MTMREYQMLASRTISKELTTTDMIRHALHGLASEVGELHSLYQKTYQGHPLDQAHAIKEVGDILWFIAEYCTAVGADLNDVAYTNIEKLRRRYPDGFEAEKSLHRQEGDE